MNKVKTILILVLISIIAYLSLRLNITRNKVAKQTNELSSKKQSYLEPELKSKIIIDNEKIIYKTRNSTSTNTAPTSLSRNSVSKSRSRETNEKTQDSSPEVYVTSKYLPPEGKAEITVDLRGNTSIFVKNKGLVFEPVISVLTTFEGVKLGVGARIAYFGRYGVSVGLNTTFLDTYKLRCFVGVDRRISDVFPLVKNTVLGIVYDGNFGIYFSVFF